eukprot:PITA_13621
MDQAKEQIKTVYKDRVAKYGPIWAIIDERWNNQLHRPIHAAEYFLNPRYHYKAKKSGALRGEVRDGLIDCIDRMIPLESDQLEIHRQATIFSNASGTFGKNLAKIAREVDEPAQWWEAFGGHVPELQRFAIRILSQTCNASGCERNWSVFERIHTKKRNRLDQKRLNDLVYVQYNLRLRRNHLLNKRPDSDPIVLEDIDPTSDWLNADPSASVSQPARTPVVGASSSQPEPRQKRSRIATLSQRASTAVAQPASGTTSTVAVGDDDDEEEPWAGGSDFDDDDDLEIDRHDLGSSGSSY